MLALYLGMREGGLHVVDSPELVDALRELAGRYESAIGASQQARRVSAVPVPGRFRAGAGGLPWWWGGVCRRRVRW